MTNVQDRINWLHLASQSKFVPQPYEQLAEVLRKLGYEDEAKTVLIKKNKDRARFTTIGTLPWWWYNVFGCFIQYGYRPWAGVVAATLFIVAGWIFFSIGYALEVLEPAQQEKAYPNGRREIAVTYPKFNSFVYSLETFVPLVKLEMGDYWTPNAKRGKRIVLTKKRAIFTTGSLLRIYLWIHIIAGWILTTLLVGAFTGLIKT
jgi:hypothetical protein